MAQAAPVQPKIKTNTTGPQPGGAVPCASGAAPWYLPRGNRGASFSLSNLKP